MCGRYSQVYNFEQLEAQLQIPLSSAVSIPANYNVAPTQDAMVLTNEQPNILQPYRWGLVPHWSKDLSHGARMINARREGIATKPSFRIPIRQRRCLVFADSFYEWRRSGQQKLPYRILRTNDDILVMAGIWDVWQKEGRRLHTFSIITTEPNAEMQGIHNRMPVLLLNHDQQQQWLQELPLEDTLELLQTPPDGVLRYYRVSQRVNSVRNDGPELHEAVSDDPLNLF